MVRLFLSFIMLNSSDSAPIKTPQAPVACFLHLLLLKTSVVIWKRRPHLCLGRATLSTPNGQYKVALPVQKSNFTKYVLPGFLIHLKSTIQDLYVSIQNQMLEYSTMFRRLQCSISSMSNKFTSSKSSQQRNHTSYPLTRCQYSKRCRISPMSPLAFSLSKLDSRAFWLSKPNKKIHMFPATLSAQNPSMEVT
jgi:hypothetical protein